MSNRIFISSKIILVFFMLLASSVVVNGQSRAEKKKAKKEKAAKTYQEMKSVVEGGKIKVIMDRATGNKGFSQVLNTNTYSLIIDNKQGETDLPFYGTSQNAGYGTESGIAFKGELMDYSIKYKENKNKIILKFSAKSSNQEQLGFIITMNGWRASVSVNSSQRSSMSYTGDLKEL